MYSLYILTKIISCLILLLFRDIISPYNNIIKKLIFSNNKIRITEFDI